MTVTTNPKNLQQYKISFSVTVEQILAFASAPNMLGEVKNLPTNLKQKLKDLTKAKTKNAFDIFILI